MGRFVWHAASANGSAWSAAHPQQQVLNSGFLAVLSWLVFLYALSGLVFGYLPFFLFTGFVALQGVPAVLVILGSLAMSLAWATHLVQRHWSTASALRCGYVRRQAWLFAGGCMALAAAVAVVADLAGLQGLHRPIALQPDADWMLSPLPWLWSHVLPLAREKVVMRMFITGVVTMVIMILFLKLNWSRPALTCLAVLMCLVGAYFLGQSALDYAASRSLAPVGLPEAMRAWRTDPGLFNAWVWLGWWGGVSTLVLGVLLLAGCTVLPARVMDAIDVKGNL